MLQQSFHPTLNFVFSVSQKCPESYPFGFNDGQNLPNVQKSEKSEKKVKKVKKEKKSEKK